MPTIVSKNKSLPLNIIGASGYTSILSTTPFYLKSDISSGNIPLYMKQTVNSGILQAETNWDFSLASNSKINHFSNGDIEYVLTDYSSNRYDSYYVIHIILSGTAHIALTKKLYRFCERTPCLFHINCYRIKRLTTLAPTSQQIGLSIYRT